MNGCPPHPSLDLGAAVRVLSDLQPWEIGLDALGVDTWLAGGEAGGTLVDLTPDLVEVEWLQGTSTAVNPTGVLPRAEAGTATLTLWDPHAAFLPGGDDPYGGIRPGREIVLYDRADSHVLWAGYVEQLEHDIPADGPGLTVLTCVDPVTKLVNSAPTPPNARSPESPHDRAQWTMDSFAPGHPTFIDPLATAAQVAGTQAGDSAWQNLVDAAEVELGGLFTLRDGTVIMLANGAGEFVTVWAATWTHEERAEAGRPFAGQIRVEDTGGEFTITAHTDPAGGAFTPPSAGQYLSVTRPQAAGFYIRGYVLTDAVPVGAAWQWTMDKSNYAWPGTPPRGEIVEVAQLDFTSNPPGSPVWVQPPCSTARVSELVYDLASLRNDVHVRRRDADTETVGFSHATDETSVGHYGRWSWRWDSSPHDTAGGELRAAALVVSTYALPRAVYARLDVNVTAAANTPELDTLLRLVRDVNLTNTILVHSGGSSGYARVYGWEWTWTAAGGMSGGVALGRSAGDPTLDVWFLGVTGAGELGETTVLGG